MEALNTYTVERTLKEKVADILTEKKMAKAELALAIGYSRSAVSRYLGGKYDSDPTELEAALARFVNVCHCKFC